MKKTSDNEFERIKSKKVNFISILCIALFIIILAAVSLTIFAWAKYNSKNNGQASAQVARWYFKVTGDGEQSANDIDFTITRTDSNRFY